MEAIEILLVEDDPMDVRLTLREIGKSPAMARVEVVRDGEEALDFLFCRGGPATNKDAGGTETIRTRSGIA